MKTNSNLPTNHCNNLLGGYTILESSEQHPPPPQHPRPFLRWYTQQHMAVMHGRITRIIRRAEATPPDSPNITTSADGLVRSIKSMKELR